MNNKLLKLLYSSDVGIDKTLLVPVPSILFKFHSVAMFLFLGGALFQ